MARPRLRVEFHVPVHKDAYGGMDLRITTVLVAICQPGDATHVPVVVDLTFARIVVTGFGTGSHAVCEPAVGQFFDGADQQVPTVDAIPQVRARRRIVQ